MEAQPNDDLAAVMSDEEIEAPRETAEERAQREAAELEKREA